MIRAYGEQRRYGIPTRSKACRIFRIATQNFRTLNIYSTWIGNSRLLHVATVADCRVAIFRNSLNVGFSSSGMFHGRHVENKHRLVSSKRITLT